ncbi:hypothetical protein C8J56DRAFT_1054804 [Mycena floridula]|nr:hypothetical protein C8J56DRAFT_1054804 [Mycena floridula]
MSLAKRSGALVSRMQRCYVGCQVWSTSPQNVLSSNLSDSTTGIDPDGISISITLPCVTRATFYRCLRDDDGRIDRNLHSSKLCALILRLTLPALRELNISVYCSTVELRNLLRRSQYPLETLSLGIYGSAPDDACIGLLDEIPTHILHLGFLAGFNRQVLGIFQ